MHRSRPLLSLLLLAAVLVVGCPGGGSASPTVVDDTINTVEETAISHAVLANDSHPDSLPLAVVAVTQSTQGGAVTVDEATNLVTYVPLPNFNGEDTFTYTAEDSDGRRKVGNVTVTVAPINDLPAVTLATSAGEGAIAGQAYAFDVVVDDVEGDLVSVRLVNPPPGLVMEPVELQTPPLTLSLVWEIPPTQGGSIGLIFEVTDSAAAGDTSLVSLNINVTAGD